MAARDHDDATDILRSIVFGAQTMPPIAGAIEDVDVSTLDSGHFIPNMDAPVFRGAWFPKDYIDSHEPVNR